MDMLSGTQFGWVMLSFSYFHLSGSDAMFPDGLSTHVLHALCVSAIEPYQNNYISIFRGNYFLYLTLIFPWKLASPTMWSSLEALKTVWPDILEKSLKNSVPGFETFKIVIVIVSNPGKLLKLCFKLYLNSLKIIIYWSLLHICSKDISQS